MSVATLEIDHLVIDRNFQPRVGLNKDVASEYASILEDGGHLPPISVVKCGAQLIVVDGFHRIQAYRIMGRDRIEAEVIEGDLDTARRLMLGANRTHGLRRSREDKVRTVQLALQDFELSTLSDCDIAKLCGVSNTFVSHVRMKILGAASGNKFSRKYPSRANAAVSTLTPQTQEGESTLPPQEVLNYDPHDDAMQMLIEENESLRSRFAIHVMEASDEDKALAQTLIIELKEEVRLLQTSVKSLTISRDQFQAENAQLKRQCSYQRSTIKKLNEQLAARASKVVAMSH